MTYQHPNSWGAGDRDRLVGRDGAVLAGTQYGRAFCVAPTRSSFLTSSIPTISPVNSGRSHYERRLTRWIARSSTPRAASPSDSESDGCAWQTWVKSSALREFDSCGSFGDQVAGSRPQDVDAQNSIRGFVCQNLRATFCLS